MTEPSADRAIERFSLASLSPLDERYAAIRGAFPQILDEDQLDGGRLALELGLRESRGRQRYGLTWPGKENASLAVQEPSVGTLIPDPAMSLEFDSARDVMIEGDNLEVLKLLQRSYYGKVKMIFIDPPYNTGNNFIYPDNFTEGLEGYLRFTGQIDDEGTKVTANAGTAGRYHSNWLSMMYPRLALARNLLRSDGVIFMTIDDHEVHNLRLLMDEIFGPENFVACLIWQKIHTRKNTARQFSANHDYVLCYARDGHEWRPRLLPRTAGVDDEYDNPDDDVRGPWIDGPVQARNYYSKGTYPIECPGGRVIDGPPRGNYWRVSEEEFRRLDADGRIWWGKDGNNVPRVKRFLSEVQAGLVPQTIWPHAEVGHTQQAKEELLARVAFASSDSVFDTPKPTRLIERMLRLATGADTEDLVVDFFAGSGATGEAVWKLNAEDGGNRRFILVQLPEPTGYDDYETVADITRARLFGTHAAMVEEADGTLDGTKPTGFRNYRLDSSNFDIWSGEPEDTAVALSLFADNLSSDANEEAVVTELLLKAGFELTAPASSVDLAGKRVHAVEGGQLLIFAGETVSLETVEEMVALDPALILILDSSFGGDDQLKVNAMQTVRSRNQGSGSDISMKVV